MPTKDVLFNIQSLKEVENVLHVENFPEDGLPGCNARLGLEIKHTDKLVSISVKIISLNEGKVAMSYGVEGIFGFDDITKYFSFDDAHFEDRVGALPVLVGIVIDALRGMQALRLSDTPYADTILPYLDAAQLLNEINPQDK